MPIQVSSEIQQIIDATADRVVAKMLASQPRPTGKLLRLNDAIAMTGLSRSAIYRLIATGTLRPIKQGRALSFVEAEIAAYVANVSGDRSK